MDRRTVTVLKYPLRISHTGTDTSVRCRLTKLQVLACRKIINTPGRSGYGMDKDSSLSASVNMCSILSPGRSHQWLPSQTAGQSVCTIPCRCSGETYRNTDCLNRNGLATICVYSHNTVGLINLQVIWSSVNTGNIITAVTILIKVIQFSIDPSACIGQILGTAVRIDIFDLIIVIADDHPAGGKTSLAVQITIYGTTLHGFICHNGIVLQIVPVFTYLLPA